MQQFNLSNLQKIYFIGIGGTSMSGLALMSQSKGLEVCGSDMRAGSYTDKLIEKGVPVIIGHDPSNVPLDCDLVVYSAAIRPTNVEYIAAEKAGIPMMERSFYLGLISNMFPDTIAVSGTHGKTTTSSLCSLMLLRAGLDPSISIGGTLDQIGGNYRVGDSNYFVIEACEFVDSFLHTTHNRAIILNIEEDHLDYFTEGIEQIKSSFTKFANILPEDGLLIANIDDPQVVEILPSIKCNRIETFSISSEATWTANNIVFDSLGKPKYDVHYNGEFYGSLELNIPGVHNIMNSLSVVALGHDLGIPTQTIAESFLEFYGAKRRFQFHGEPRGVKIFEDYAHHPTELQVTIAACKNYEHEKLWVVFQPHTYSRTFFLFDGFVNACAEADEVIFNDIYSDREANDWNIYSEDVTEKVKEKYGVPASVITEFEDIVSYLCENTKPGDLVLVAGSQTINQVAVDLVKALGGKEN
ncbi:MAG: UDP-N-acetylmuramate--L-alanine ligase [Eubacteriaceae bacterium]|nr:UDP-N-acetylmuramate--L-alanine ligase [Eubacteriaceae bacterium]